MNFYGLRVNKCELSVYTFRILMKCTHICAAQNNLLTLRQIINEPDFPCLADEKAEPRPDIDVKVTTLTESKQFYYTFLVEPVYAISDNVVCATSKASDQPAQSDQSLCSSLEYFMSVKLLTEHL